MMMMTNSITEIRLGLDGARKHSNFSICKSKLAKLAESALEKPSLVGRRYVTV